MINSYGRFLFSDSGIKNNFKHNFSLNELGSFSNRLFIETDTVTRNETTYYGSTEVTLFDKFNNANISAIIA